MVALGRAVQRMNWSPAENRVQRADTGHQVSASKGPDGTGWKFSAWGPTDQPALSFWKWKERQPVKWHYKVGEEVPQRTPSLGVFDSAAEARAACERDFLKGQPSAENTGVAITTSTKGECEL